MTELVSVQKGEPTKQRRRKRKVVRGATSRALRGGDASEFAAIYKLAVDVAGNEVSALLARAAERGFAAAGAPNFLASLNWNALLQLLPFIIEYCETFREMPGAEKEAKALSLIVKLSDVAGHSDLIDDNALTTLRLLIKTTIDVSKGNFEINAETKRAIGQAVVAAITWLFAHCRCGGGGAPAAANGDQRR